MKPSTYIEILPSGKRIKRTYELTKTVRSYRKVYRNAFKRKEKP